MMLIMEKAGTAKSIYIGVMKINDLKLAFVAMALKEAAK